MWEINLKKKDILNKHLAKINIKWWLKTFGNKNNCREII